MSRPTTQPSGRNVARCRLVLERLEERTLLSNPVVGSDGSVTITLDEVFDLFGFQPVGIQAFDDRASFAIVDTGASVITFSHFDQFLFKLGNDPIPIKVPNGAEAHGIGGTLIGDVSEPGTMQVDGLHVASLTFDKWGFPEFQFAFDENSAILDGVQVMVGNRENSPFLPTVAGTPMLLPSDRNPDGLALRIDTQGYLLDFSELLPGVVIPVPDVRYVSPASSLTKTDKSIDPIVIPIELLGTTNHPNPGNQVTEAPNPTILGIDLREGAAEVQDQTFLFDTGAMLSVISTQAAVELGLDLANPEFEIDVMGAAGTAVEVGGYLIDELRVPLASGAELIYQNVPVFVLDVAEGIVDGLFGTNLLNPAESVLYSPYHPDGPRVEVTFFAERFLEEGKVDPTALALLSSVSPVLANAVSTPQVPTFTRPVEAEPSAPPELDRFEPNDRPREATDFDTTFFVSETGLTGAAGQIDWYRFRAERRALATVNVDVRTGADVVIRVRDIQRREWVAVGHGRVDFFTRPGHRYLIRVRVRSATPQWYDIQVQQGIRLQDGTLRLIGTGADDQIQVAQNSGVWIINQLAYSPELLQEKFAEDRVDALRVYGRGGDDHMELAPSVLVDAVLVGGAGNDYLQGGSANDLLRGGTGIDELFGGFGDDILRGDRDDDQLHGGPGQDALYGGQGYDILWTDLEDLLAVLGPGGGELRDG